MSEHGYAKGSDKGQKKPRERHNCCVPQCSTVKTESNHLHRVPSEASLRAKWAVAIKTGKTLSDNMRVCSRHFKDEDYCISRGAGFKKRLKLNSVPSQNLPLRVHEKVLSSPLKRKQAERIERAKKRANMTLHSCSEPHPSDSDCGGSDTEGRQGQEGGQQGKETGGEWEDVPEIRAQDEKIMKDAGVQVESDSGFISSILTSNKRVFSLTGIHSVGLLNCITKCFDEIAPENRQRKFSLCSRDRIVLTMMKIKLGIHFSSLAALFDLNDQTCINYFKDSVVVLAKILKCMIFWPDKEDILKNMPKCFSKYKSTRVILDAYEIPVEKPKCIMLYSQYKKGFTAKVMMICAPCGLITHTSSAFGGRASDKVVTKNTGIYQLCEMGDAVMLDKGFNIEQECHDNLLILIRPPFLRQKNKFSKAESVECAKIARARVHVERVIQRVRLYHFLQNKIPWNLCPYLDNIVTIVCALVNLGNPILAMDKF